jgi:hypothetical protein
MKSLVILFIFLISINTQASCIELLKDHLSLDQGQILHYQELLERYSKKEAKLLEQLEENKISPNAPTGAAVYLREYLNTFETNVARKALIEFIPSIYMNTPLIRDWARDLSTHITRKILSSKNSTLISRQKNYDEIHRNILIEVLTNRLQEAGFSSNIRSTRDELTESQFGQTLQNRELILDDFFISDPHGPFIHILQLDLIRFSAKRFGHDPKTLGDFYEWMGKNERIKLPEANRSFSPLAHTWDLMFDSFRWDLTAPEIFNPILENYFGI